jgi:hypothetical protein
MKARTILFCLIVGFFGVVIGRASAPVTFTSTATVTLTLGTSTVSQAAADAQQTQFLVDYCTAKGLSTATPGATVIADVKAIVKNTVVAYRADQAAATQRAIDTAAIQP